jgi:cytochrome P450
MSAVFTYDPFSVAAMSEPLEQYRVLRDEHPMYRLDAYGAWAVSRFEDVYAVLSDTEGRFTGAEGTLMQPDALRTPNHGVVPAPAQDPLPMFPLQESPQYEQTRQALGAPLRPGAVGRLAELVRALARARLDELVPRGRFNLTADYGGEVAAATMCHLFGLPLTRARLVLDVVNSTTVTDPEVGGRQESQDVTLGRLHGLIADVVAQRRAAGADGRHPVIDGLLAHTHDGRGLTDAEICDQLIVVLVGGAETLPKVVAHGLMELAARPEQRAAVVADPANAKAAFEEMLRFCAPAQWFTRTVKVPTTIGGQDLEAGDRLVLLLASANRDEREFADPDAFRWNREIPRHLAFGHGQHFCIGNHVARLEGRILVEELLARIPDYAIDVDAARRPPSSFQWGWMEVPLVVPTP